MIGLETMPRTMDNIGFYSGLGFVPGKLTITLTLDAANADRAPELLGRLSVRDRDDELSAVQSLVSTIAPGYDFRREIELTESLSLGDTVLLREGSTLVGFALCHTAPLVEGRTREELRVLKLVMAREASFDAMIRTLCDYAKRSGTRRVAWRVQGEYSAMYQKLIALGARVRWTDLRMALDGFAESPPTRGLLLSNWEIWARRERVEAGPSTTDVEDGLLSAHADQNGKPCGRVYRYAGIANATSSDHSRERIDAHDCGVLSAPTRRCRVVVRVGNIAANATVGILILGTKLLANRYRCCLWKNARSEPIPALQSRLQPMLSMSGAIAATSTDARRIVIVNGVLDHHALGVSRKVSAGIIVRNAGD